MGKEDFIKCRTFHAINGAESDVYALKFNHAPGFTDLFLATTRNHCGIYKCEDRSIRRFALFTDPDENESYYACDWLRTVEGEFIVAAGGRKGIISIFSAPRQGRCGVSTLQGHMEEVNDLQAHPTRTNLLLSASHDQQVRLWDVHKHICIAAFGTPTISGHRSAVTSVAWMYPEPYFVSGGWDGSVKMWDITKAQDALKRAEAWPTLQERQAAQAASPTHEPHPNFVFVQVETAIFESPEVHAEVAPAGASEKAAAGAANGSSEERSENQGQAPDRQWVDTVATVGSCVLSRSGPFMPHTRNSNLTLWEPLLVPPLGPGSPLRDGPSHRYAIRKKYNMECKRNIWWIRFSLCSNRRVLAAGSDHGYVYVHQVFSRNPHANTTLDTGLSSVVRSTAVSADGRTILAGTSCGRICRWDRRNPWPQPTARGLSSRTASGPTQQP